MAFAIELQHRTVVNKAVNHSGRRHRVGEHLRPLLERKVRRQRDACTFVASRNDVEEQIGLLAFEWDVSELGNEQ